MFVAIKGEHSDGHQFIAKAIENGAKSIVCEEFTDNLSHEITQIKVRNSAEALGYLASEFYDNPSEKIKLIGITGTNGKTTSVTLLYQLFRDLGYCVGLFSTIRYLIQDEEYTASHTTPNPLIINKLLANLVKQGGTHAFMEVSSHALVQHRVTGLRFSGAIFSNITHDHLDYHGSFDEYIRAKKLFFDHLPKSAFALVNRDDKNGLKMLQNCKSRHYTFALRLPADFKGKVLDNSFQGLELEINGKSAWFRLPGEFNGYNLTGVYATAVLCGEDSDEILRYLSHIQSVAGRFEQIISTKNICAIVDYSHTPDALENVLKAISQIRTNNENLITVVGCGGNRDAGKRPKMADIACKFSNQVILTSDNPRFENPKTIIEQMQKGVQPADFKKVKAIENRREAILKAVEIAQPNDIILIAGKGHENYQEIEGVKYPFDDKEEVKKNFNKFSK